MGGYAEAGDLNYIISEMRSVLGDKGLNLLRISDVPEYLKLFNGNFQTYRSRETCTVNSQVSIIQLQ